LAKRINRARWDRLQRFVDRLNREFTDPARQSTLVWRGDYRAIQWAWLQIAEAIKEAESSPARLTDSEKGKAIGSAEKKTVGETPEGWQLIAVELEKAARKFPTWPVRGTDAAAIVAEECGELQQAVLQATYEGGSVEAVRKEAIQTAAMAMQFLLNLPDTQFDRGEQLPKRRLPLPPSPQEERP
jgi:hypothetical protein